MLLLLIILAALPGYPPFINLVLKRALADGSGRITWRKVSGYALTGLNLEGVNASGEGYQVRIKKLRVDYNLLALAGGKLPLALELRGGKIKLDPAKLTTTAATPGAKGGGFSLLLRKLVLQDVKIESDAWPEYALPSYRLEIGGEMPNFDWRLQTGDGELAGRLSYLNTQAWKTTFHGDVAVSRFWWDGKQKGIIEGTFAFGKGHWLGKARLTGGSVVLAGFPVERVSGALVYRDHVIKTELRGFSLGGALAGSGEVDIPAQKYTFHVEGSPKLQEMLKLWKISLPASGQGPLVIDGSGWEDLKLRGVFSGAGSFLSRRLDYKGEFDFARGQFSLKSRATGSVLDRSWKAEFRWRDGGYQLSLSDDKGSQAELRGEGDAYRGSGSVVWPYPLRGSAFVSFAGKGDDWRAQVASPDVGLLLLKKPLDLSGALCGRGMEVSGRLGPLSLRGRWDDLDLSLAETPLIVGEVAGRGRWNGHFEFSGAYRSPYASMPVRVVQDGQVWRLSAPGHGQGEWRDGSFAFELRRLGIDLLGGMTLSGNARWRPAEGWSGSQRLRGPYLSLDSHLRGDALNFSGVADTPAGELPISGRADAKGLLVRSQKAVLAYSNGQISLSGRLELGPYSYSGAMSKSGEGWYGKARLSSPWANANLIADGVVNVTSEGLLNLQGRLWPDTKLSGSLRLPLGGRFSAADLPVAVAGDRARIGDGWLALRSPFDFQLKIPVEGYGHQGLVLAEGDFRAAKIRLQSEWGEVLLQGAWKDMKLAARLRLPRLGEARLAGRVNLPALAYQIKAELPDAGGEAIIEGKKLAYDWSASLQRGALQARGEGRTFSAKLDNFDSSSYGLPGLWNGRLAYRQGLDADLGYRGPYGDLMLKGFGTIQVSGSGRGYRLGGYFDAARANLIAKINEPYLAGELSLRGPWDSLKALGEGSWRLPLLRSRQWTFAADVSSRTWGLAGPLTLRGKGLRYQGSISWRDELYGKPLLLTGRLRGEGSRLRGALGLSLAGYKVRSSFDYEDDLSLGVLFPRGSARYAHGELSLRGLDLQPLGEALGLDLGGMLAGRLNIVRLQGSLAGSLRYGGESFGVKLAPQGDDWTLSLYDAERAMGLRLGSAGGGYLVGLGEIAGRLDFAHAWSGALNYRNASFAAGVRALGDHLDFSLDYGKEHLRGTYRPGSVAATWRGPFYGNVELQTGDLSYRARAGVRLAQVEGLLDIKGEKDFWSGRGYLVSYQLLPQAGSLSASGRGLSWKVGWYAPLSVVASGQAARLETLRLSGAGIIGGVSKEWGRVRSDLSFAKGVFRGSLSAAGEAWSLRAQGRNERLILAAEAYGMTLSGSSAADGSLDVEMHGERRLLGDKVTLAGNLTGAWYRPRLHSRLLLEGRGGKQLHASFDYRRGWSLRMKGDGLLLEADGKRTKLLARGFDLAPFLGLPLKLDAAGDGATAALVAPLHVYGASLDMRGEWYGASKRLYLRGTLLDGKAAIGWSAAEGASLSLDLPKPRVNGNLWYRNGELGGTLDVDATSANGGIRGHLDAAARRLRLRGYGEYSGELRLDLSPLSLSGDLSGPEWFLSGSLAKAPYGVWLGSMRMVYPRVGGLLFSGQDKKINVTGTEGLEPLRAAILPDEGEVNWSYHGDLPDHLGELQAQGAWPSADWLRGEWSYLNHRIRLLGRGASLKMDDSGLDARLGAGGFDAKLSNFVIAGLPLSGTMSGDWRSFSIDLTAAGLRVQGGVLPQTDLQLSGWLQGRVTRNARGWSGRLDFTGGEAKLGGDGLMPELAGTWYGKQFSLAYPLLSLGGLELNLEKRAARGEVALGDLLLRGAGGALALSYPLPKGELQAKLGLRQMDVGVWSTTAGKGLLEYKPERGFSGELSLDLGVISLDMLGKGGEVEYSANHPSTPWLPWGEGKFSGDFALTGEWRLDYLAPRVSLRCGGKGLKGSFELKSPWGGGELRYQDGWRGGLSLRGWPVAPLEAELSGELRVADGDMAASGELAGKAGRLSFSLRADAQRLLPKLENVSLVVENTRIESLPRWLNKIPYASGRVDGTFGYAKGMVSGRLVSKGLTVGKETFPLEAAVYWTRELKTLELNLDRSHITGEWRGNKVYLQGETVRLPLHFLLGAFTGPLEGVAYWTGALKADLRLDDLRKSYVVLAGERLQFSGGGDDLRGSGAMRYQDGVFYLDKLDIAGKGSWRGSGYYGPDDADLVIEVKNTVFTPILALLPQLRRYKAAAAGGLTLSAKGRNATLKLDDLSFSLAGLHGRIGRTVVVKRGENLDLQSEIELEKPYRSKVTVKGSGTTSSLPLQIHGDADLPLLGRLDNIAGKLIYPKGTISLNSNDATINGSLWPLKLSLSGELPVAMPQKYLKSGLVKPKLNLRYQKGEYLLSGAIKVERAVLARPEGKKAVSFEQKRYTLPLRFEKVHIFSNGGILVREPLAKGEAKGDVYLSGSLADPYLSGRADAIWGEFFLGRHRFAVDEGWAEFDPSGGLYPRIYLKAHSEVKSGDDYLQLYLQTDGSFVKEGKRARLVLKPRIWAEKNGKALPYSQEELLQLLALGDNVGVAEGAASLAIQNLLIAQLEYQLSKALGLDIFTLDTNVFSGGPVETTQFTIGKYVSTGLLLTYSINLQGQQAIGAEYRLDNLRLRVESKLGGDIVEPQVRFSMIYAINPDLDLILRLRTGKMLLGLEWRF